MISDKPCEWSVIQLCHMSLRKESPYESTILSLLPIFSSSTEVCFWPFSCGQCFACFPCTCWRGDNRKYQCPLTPLYPFLKSERAVQMCDASYSVICSYVATQSSGEGGGFPKKSACCWQNSY